MATWSAPTTAVYVSEHGPIDLETALRFLPLVAAAGEYDAWAVRWLRRWAGEPPGATIEAAAEIAGSLCRATAFRGSR